MASTRLSNYLRMHRKRLGLSQEDVARLLGTESGAQVCRYETFSRTPQLETALAFEVIFKKPVSELFAGLYQKIEKKVTHRAAKQLRYAKDVEQNTHARQVFEALADPADIKKRP